MLQLLAIAALALNPPALPAAVNPVHTIQPPPDERGSGRRQLTDNPRDGISPTVPSGIQGGPRRP